MANLLNEEPPYSHTLPTLNSKLMWEAYHYSSYSLLRGGMSPPTDLAHTSPSSERTGE